MGKGQPKKLKLDQITSGILRAIRGVVQMVSGRASAETISEAIVKAAGQACHELGNLTQVSGDSLVATLPPTRVTLAIDPIKALLPDPSGNRYYPVVGYKKLNVQVTPNGQKAFVIRYRISRRQKSYTICQFNDFPLAEVTTKFSDALGLISKGIDPNEARMLELKEAAVSAASVIRVSDLISRYKSDHVPTLSESWRNETLRLFEKHVIEKSFTGMDVKEVDPGHVSDLLAKIAKTKTQRNLLRAVLRTMFRKAEEWGWRNVGSNPVAVVSRLTTKRARTRRLSEKELVSLGRVFSTSKESVFSTAAIKLYLMTGMRKSELIGDIRDKIPALTWDRVDLETGVLHVYGKGLSKELRTRPVHCGRPVIELLRSLPRLLGNPHVIPGAVPGHSLVGIQKIWERVRIAAGFAVEGVDSDENPTIHDLRRTFGSVGIDLGHDDVMGPLLGHTEKDVTDVYTRSSIENLLDAADDISMRIDGILTGFIDPIKEQQDKKAAREAARPIRALENIEASS
jgi:integrase